MPFLRQPRLLGVFEKLTTATGLGHRSLSAFAPADTLARTHTQVLVLLGAGFLSLPCVRASPLPGPRPPPSSLDSQGQVFAPCQRHWFALSLISQRRVWGRWGWHAGVGGLGRNGVGDGGVSCPPERQSRDGSVCFQGIIAAEPVFGQTRR